MGATTDDSGGRPDVTDSGSDSGLDQIESALGEIRREGRKVAAVNAVVDATLLVLATNLVVVNFGPAFLSGEIGLPAVLPGFLEGTPGSVGSIEVDVPILLAIVAGFAAFATEYSIRVRRPLVEQFEHANPELQTALRTARDAAASRSETRMSLRLYEDVLERLRGASSTKLLDTTRVGVSVLAIVGLSLLTVQLAAVDFDLQGLNGIGDSAGSADSGPSMEYEGLQGADTVLGDREDVEAGDEKLTAKVASSGGDSDPAAGRVGGYDTGDPSGASNVEGQQAGYAGVEDVADADLIREYNLKIREENAE